MTTEAEVLDLDNMPCGYVYEPEAIEATDRAYSAGPPMGIEGQFKASKLSYFNLRSIVAGFLRRDKIVSSNRKLIDLGDDGVVFTPLAQQTGICNGCSHGEADTCGWISTYSQTGTGLFPSETSFAWAYLVGRTAYVGRGDTGAVPSLTVQAYHDIGALPMCVAPELAKLPPHGPGSQESVCIQYRDNPQAFINLYKSRCEPYRSRVFRPKDAWLVADLIYSFRPVTVGCGYQMRETAPGSNGISPLYSLGGGHETELEGIGLLNGRLFGIKYESWYQAGCYPASKWPNHRVVVQTDGGPHTLYPGQGALWLDELMPVKPELWAIDNPGSI